MITDQTERDQARFNLENNVVVEAGAGTGKTTLLIDRLLATLLAGGKSGGGVPADKVAAVTFTEKAAAEMKARLGAALADVLACLNGTDLGGERQRKAEETLENLRGRFHLTAPRIHAAAQKALADLDRMMVGTLHHFAAHILRLFPLEAGVDPAFAVDKGPFFDDLFEEQWALWLDQELGLESRHRREWLELLPLVPLDDLTELAKALCRDETGQGQTGATGEQWKQAGKTLEILEKMRAYPAPPSGKMTETLDSLAAHWRELTAAREGGAAWPAVFKKAGFQKRAWPKTWAALDGEETFEYARRVGSEVSALSDRVVRKAAALLRPFSDDLRALYARRGHVGFYGLLARARAVVRENTAVRQALKERYEALFIDEFQDTDPLQGELMLFLAEEAGGTAAEWEHIKYAPGKLFVVGDPKQSIYRFRGADIRAYETFTRHLMGQGALKVTLTDNFRSVPGILGTVNAVFNEVMKETRGLQPPYQPLVPGRRGDPGTKAQEAGVELVLFPEVDKEGNILRAPERQAAESRWMARWIEDYCRRPDNETSGAPRRSYKDVAVLLRTTSFLPPLLDAFKERGIPYVVEGDRRFFSAQEVIDFVNLLRVLDDPEDRLSLAGLLRSPLGGLTDGDVTAVLRGGGAKLSPEGRRRYAGLMKRVEALRSLAGRLPLGVFVGRAMEGTHLLELSSAAYYGEQTISNLLKFRRLAQEAERERGSTLKGFVEEVTRFVADEKQEGESPLADEHLDAVRVLTIHKAKGLEFPVVLLPNVSARKGGGGDRPVSRVDWQEKTAGFRLPQSGAADVAYALMEQEELAREEHEKTRLLYVAMTRARHRLILLGGEKPGDKHAFSHLLSQAGLWREAGGPSAGEGDVIVRKVDAPASAAALSGRPLAKNRGEIQIPRMFRERWKQRVEECAKIEGTKAFLRPSDEVDEGGVERKKPVSSAGDQGARVGRLCHGVLETWNYSAGGDLEEALRGVCRKLSFFEPSAPWNDAALEAKRILGGFLLTDIVCELANAEIMGREIPFLYSAAGVVVRGAIDVLYRSRGRLYVADYKTGGIHAGQGKELSRRYGAQAKHYTRAVQEALGEPCRFRLIFLRNGEVVDI